MLGQPVTATLALDFAVIIAVAVGLILIGARMYPRVVV